MTISVWKQVQNEMNQSYDLRAQLFDKISKNFENRYVISFYTRFGSKAAINEADAQMLTNMLSGSLKTKKHKLLLVINSPGGDPLAAEKIIKVLAEYSENDYWVLIPGVAKSAATMISLGSSRIILSPVSELGPIDLQIARGERLIPAYSIITAYDNLMKRGIDLGEKKRIEPILQQLQEFNPAEIEVYRQINELASDIAIKVLKKGMLKKLNKEKIKKMIKIFIDPAESKVHGRPVFYSDIKDIKDIKDIDKDNKFNLQLIQTDDPKWKAIIEYHTRVESHFAATDIQKLLESDEGSFRV